MEKTIRNKVLRSIYLFRWVIVALAAIVSVLLIAFKTNINELAMNWGAFSAIGTFFAAVVALMFGLSEMAIRKREREMKASLAASSLMATAVALRQHIHWALEELNGPDSLNKPARDVISLAVGHLNAFSLVSEFHLESLYEEDSKMALALAGSLADLKNRAYILNMDFTLSPKESWMEYTQRLPGQINMLSMGLQETAENFNRAASVAESIRNDSYKRYFI